VGGIGLVIPFQEKDDGTPFSFRTIYNPKSDLHGYHFSNDRSNSSVTACFAEMPGVQNKTARPSPKYRATEISPCMMNKHLESNKNDLRILEKYKTIKRLELRDSEGNPIPVPKKGAAEESDSEEEDPNKKDIKFSKRAGTKTFYKGASSMYFGEEPTYKIEVAEFDGPENHVKKRLDRLASLYLPDEKKTTSMFNVKPRLPPPRTFAEEIKKVEQDTKLKRNLESIANLQGLDSYHGLNSHTFMKGLLGFTGHFKSPAAAEKRKGSVRKIFVQEVALDSKEQLRKGLNVNSSICFNQTFQQTPTCARAMLK
jgi:hypothetical protein